jgi:hypothetical protein
MFRNFGVAGLGYDVDLLLSLLIPLSSVGVAALKGLLQTPNSQPHHYQFHTSLAKQNPATLEKIVAANCITIVVLPSKIVTKSN